MGQEIVTRAQHPGGYALAAPVRLPREGARSTVVSKRGCPLSWATARAHLV